MKCNKINSFYRNNITNKISSEFSMTDIERVLNSACHAIHHFNSEYSEDGLRSFRKQYGLQTLTNFVFFHLCLEFLHFLTNNETFKPNNTDIYQLPSNSLTLHVSYVTRHSKKVVRKSLSLISFQRKYISVKFRTQFLSNCSGM